MDLGRDWIFKREACPSVIVNLPHDAMLEETRRADCHNGVHTGYFPGGKYIYTKRFEILAEQIGKTIVLHFEGVYRNAVIKLNGVLAASHRNGYTEFTVDISGCVICGQNELVVEVDNSLEPNSRWYTGSGIYRPAHLIIKEKKHIDEVKITTLDYDPATIRVECTPANAEVEIFDEDDCIASGRAGDFVLPKTKLWSADAPHRLKCHIKTETDEKWIVFGIRKLEWSAETGLLVNGKEVKLRGGCIHHDNGILGACSFADAEERKVRLMKEAGFNAIRSSHNPCSSALLEACDRLGMYVVDEAFDGWYTPKTHHDYSRDFPDNYSRDIADMVARDYNHPSVIMYSIGNEVSETGTDKGRQLACEMVKIIHSLDTSRPVTCGLNVMLTIWASQGQGGYKDSKPYRPEPLPPLKDKAVKKTGSALFNALMQRLGAVMSFQVASQRADKVLDGLSNQFDVVGLNYGHKRYDKEMAGSPRQIIMGSETLVGDLSYNWERVKKHKAIIGDFCWTAVDYLGEAGIGYWTYPSYKGLPLLAGCGALDLLGNPGAENGYQQVVWGLRSQPYIGVRPVNYCRERPIKKSWRFTDAIPSWSWHGYENERAFVEVYTDAAYAELRINGKSIGKRKIKNYCAVFRTRYTPGKLEAISYSHAGDVMSKSCLTTAEQSTVICAVPEKNVLRANGQDICFVSIELADENGVWKPARDVEITIDVKGPAALQGFGSGAFQTDEVFDKNTHLTFQGRALAAVRAGYASGQVQITISAEGFKSKIINISICE